MKENFNAESLRSVRSI